VEDKNSEHAAINIEAVLTCPRNSPGPAVDVTHPAAVTIPPEARMNGHSPITDFLKLRADSAEGALYLGCPTSFS